MSKSILQALPELVAAGVIPPETAEQIRRYYREQTGKPNQVLFLVFGILGALLVGLGIILILAHNWDELARPVKTNLAFGVLVLGQILAGYALLKKAGQPVWLESTATFLLLAVGASISLVSQIYHIHTDSLGGFLLTWLLLGLPLIYLLPSSAVSLLYLSGLTVYAVAGSDTFLSLSPATVYTGLLLASLPHYYGLCRQKPHGYFTLAHHWLLPLSVSVALLASVAGHAEILAVAFFSLLSLFCLIGNSGWPGPRKLYQNAYLVIGTLGSLGLLLALSFSFYWEYLLRQHYTLAELLMAPECRAAALLTLLSLALLVGRYRQRQAIRPLEVVFLFFLLIFFSAFYRPELAVILVNLSVLAIGLELIYRGSQSAHLGLLNMGLLLVAVLITCRFFDTHLSFILRGLLFVLVGAGFFFANYRMLRKRKSYEP